MINLDQVQAAMGLHRVQRFQTRYLLENYDVGNHTHRACVLYRHFGGKEIDAALTHDNEEYKTGDIPGPAKHSGMVKVSKKLKEKYCVPFKSKKQERLFKMCDALDIVIHLQGQVAMSEEHKIIYQKELATAMNIARDLKKLKVVERLLKDIK